MTHTIPTTRVRNDPPPLLVGNENGLLSWNVRPIAHFDVMADQWDEMVRSCPGTPFLASMFLKPLLDVFGNGDELLCFLHCDGQPCIAAILRRVKRGLWETFQPSQLPLGAWISTGKIELGIACATLMRQLPGLVLGIGITQIDSRIQPRPAEDSSNSRTQDYIKTAWVDIDGDFETYWNARGKNLRQNVRKGFSKLAAEHKEPRIECLTAPDDVMVAVGDYALLETTGWKGKEGTAVAIDNAQGTFYRRMFEEFCGQRRGRIYRYWIDDKVAAMDLCIHDDNVLVILKTAYDESFKSYSPSTLMRYEEFRQLFAEHRFRRIEFFGRVMEWHTRWTSSQRDIFHMTFYRRHSIKALHGFVSRLGKWGNSRAKEALKTHDKADSGAGESIVRTEPVEPWAARP